MSVSTAQENLLLAAWPSSGLPLHRIARTAGLPPGTAGAVANACLRRGWLTVTPTGGFVTTAKGRRKVQ